MGRVFIIDDDPDVADALACALTDEGYAVDLAHDGAHGLATLRTAQKPDVILLDLMMPVMDGYAFRAAQLQDAALRDIPVVVLTAGTPAVDGQLAGVAALLRKPIALRELLQAIERASARSATARK
jgi:CheY-like chemotaxis protein